MREESLRTAGAGGGPKIDSSTEKAATVRNCFTRVPILISRPHSLLIAMISTRKSQVRRNYYGKLRYQRLWTHRAQRAPRHDAKTGGAHPRDQSSDRHENARPPAQMGFGARQVRRRNRSR